MFSSNLPIPMYEILIYPIAARLWRWEIRSNGALLRCGTARTEAASEGNALEVLDA
jgi:hypothetical protein